MVAQEIQPSILVDGIQAMGATGAMAAGVWV